MSEERKLVTILFADVTGSTALGESLDPEDLHALMGRYYAHARRIVADYGGSIEKFIGDAVMAVFGLPLAHSNDAERALAAAIALRDAVASDTLLRDQFILRIGANTGSVIVPTASANASQSDFLAMGDAVNVAARLEQHAIPGEILASSRTAAAAQSSFLFAPARVIEVKGKSQPLRVFPVSGQRPTRQLNRPPLVGRKSELAQLGLLRERALENRRPQLISIVAPAGTGKTRLLEEFLAKLRPREGWRIATAQCLPYGQTLTYWPLRGLLEEMLGVAFSLEAVTDVYIAGGYTPEDAARLAGLALTALGVEVEGQVESEALFSAWRLLIEALAKRSPRIIVFEDLHWASESLLDLVEHVMQPRTVAPLLIIATSRPELLDRRSGWGGGLRSFTALALEPLSSKETQKLVGALVEGAPEEIRARIVERSGGNPFFAIELSRGLEGEEAMYDSLPDTVQEAVQERMDALAPRERTVLQAAAVVGHTFRSATLQAAVEMQALAEVEMALENLQARDLITPAEGGAYEFRHILIRDVAYGSLSRIERVRLHLVVARWLEDFAAGRIDEFVELIAYHYAEAAQLARQSAVPLQTSVDIARAIEYLERAAALAFQAGALIEARGYLERAIALAPESEHRRLYEALGDRSVVLSHVAVPAYHAALDLWRAEAQPPQLEGARLLRKLSMHFMRWNGGMTPDEAQRAEMMEVRAETRRLTEQAGDEYEQWRLRVADLFWYWWTGDSPADSAPTLLAAGWEAADYFEARGDWDAFSEALDGYGTLAFMIGDWNATFAASKRRLAVPALTLYERIDALSTVAWAQSNSGDYAGAIATVRGLIAQRRPGELATAFASLAFSARQDAYWSGAWSEFARFDAVLAEAWEETGRHPEDPRSIRLWQGDYIYTLLIALARDNKAAVEHATETLGQLTSLETRDGRRQALQLWIKANLQDDPAPIELALHAISSKDELELLPTFGSLCQFLTERGLPAPKRVLNLIADGRAIQVVDNLKRWFQIALALAADDNARLAQAIDDAEAHGLIPHAARMRVVLAQRASDRAQLERARPTLERLGDKLFLRKLEEVEAALG